MYYDFLLQGQEGIYRRRSSFDEPLVTENVYERLESINYAQHDNDAYNSDNTPTHSPNAINLSDSYAGEQSSKLWYITLICRDGDVQPSVLHLGLL